MRFVDEATITVRSGKGGNGCMSFRREKFVPKGGPDGGDGGKGGDVILRATSDLLTLQDQRLKRHYDAENGRPGLGRQKYGRAGEDMVVELPVGTLVFELPGSESEDAGDPAPDAWGDAEGCCEDPVEGMRDDLTDDAAWEPLTPQGAGGERLVADLDRHGMEVVVARGGRGGKGNTHFKSATMRAPRFAQPGEAGQEKRLRLELKILADCGLLGLPNAGKSTFISQVSAARPKIADYAFTTLTPNLGVVVDDIDPDRRMVVADIPGLIEGAHAGLGLGHRFLRHVERTRFLVHLLAADDVSLDDPESLWEGFDLVNEELRQYDQGLAAKRQLLAVNKIDLLEPEALEAIKGRAKAQGMELYCISALTGEGVDALLAAMWRAMEEV